MTPAAMARPKTTSVPMKVLMGLRAENSELPRARPRGWGADSWLPTPTPFQDGFEGLGDGDLEALPCTGNEARRQPLAMCQRESIFGPKYVERGGEGVGPGGIRSNHPHGCECMLHRPTDARVDGVGVAPAIALVEVAVVAVGGQGCVLEAYDGVHRPGPW
jgi:hypothetical protein